ncbi:CpsB/CapC family capsule biosynthesis tyrosine phosphatase [Bacillus sp. REN10]|uniref:tyrosine-protein phosphatase n=1 Tax=Bacillus sp. REN10 TaxID=2782541 RepID=UPI00193B0C6B|nr:CpsB/CapC family capsule biosynthesis tyrosine phosphatase [Bacillus sp. REN10]
MIDLHCHILSGADDGAASNADSLAMVLEAEKQGITKIVATPHHKNGLYDNEKNEIVMRVAKLNEEIRHAGLNVQILPGQEIRMYGELIEDYDHHKLLTVGGKSSYLLIEFPSGYIPQYAEKMLFDIHMKGLIPIIAHPERNQEMIEHPDKLYKLVMNGALTQITAASYIGHFGKKIKGFTEQLIEANLAHFIASDAHNTSNRTFHLAEAYDKLQSQMGEDALFYFQQNANYAIDGQPIHKKLPSPIRKKKKFFGVF